MGEAGPSSRVSPGKDFVAGGVGGACLLFVGHPLDTIKVRLQTQAKISCSHDVFYSGTYDCFRKTVSKEGFRGLYKGMGAPLAGVAPMMAISFFGYGLGKQLLQPEPSIPHTYTQIYLSGTLAGVFTTVIVAPGERIKCLLQANDILTLCAGCFRSAEVFRTCRLCCAALQRTGASQCLQRDHSYASQSVHQLSTPKILLAGGTAGILNWMVALPPDVLKSNFQTAADGRYKGLKDVLKGLLQEEGAFGLYKGFNAVMLRAFPANAACFLGFEVTLKFLNWLAPAW
ncbi:mitochondrial carnitine/acylcarnitine carrier protein-like isoform X3 [Denticeps clupeoides]|uniref:mitochondrial carnitine/acylcarnitine carrier protein-like isoform X3 n=1 Tax=Denticeps clupeoides TaxID=299321 RepID=UPI0010A51360|nr:mitochondrial carnitine/acylcarnitine carrier protein-like isoform X3 [Denticeps clupeoides]